MPKLTVNKSTVGRWQRELIKHQIAIGKRRDALDKTIDELYELKGLCERACDSLQEARDALSELV